MHGLRLDVAMMLHSFSQTQDDAMLGLFLHQVWGFSSGSSFCMSFKEEIRKKRSHEEVV